MLAMLVTPDTSQFEMSPLKLEARSLLASKNNMLISVTQDTFQDPTGPLKQSSDGCRHSSMAAWSSSLDFGVHPAEGYDYRDQAVEHLSKVSCCD